MTLASLKEQGVRIAIDDFGIGYSRLQSIDDSDDALLLVKAIVQLGTTLGLAVTAEGIGTASQVTALRALGCDRGQGYYLGRPTPGADRLIDLGHLAVAGRVQHRAQIRA
jgi:EAL domain-containing protein (putative c-di-GMP-specific phosphodiesterase class I)